MLYTNGILSDQATPPSVWLRRSPIKFNAHIYEFLLKLILLLNRKNIVAHCNSKIKARQT